MAEKNKVEVRIGGVDYTLVGAEPYEYMQKVALYIDKKMNEIMRINNKLSTAMASVLTAVNVADDYFKAVEGERQLRLEVERLQAELERLKEDNKRLAEENASLNGRNSSLQVELAKKEVELGEIKNQKDRGQRPRIYINKQKIGDE